MADPLVFLLIRKKKEGKQRARERRRTRVKRTASRAANQYMDPYYSHYRNHAPYPYYPPPGCWEVGHPRMAMDSSCRPLSYGPWTYNSSMNHPPEFHSCCNHTYPPGYYSFRPPSPQEIPPPHLYYHGPFPQHPNAYPSYFAPPPPYPVDQTAYGYDKFKSHCCGCPNHSCHGGEKGNIRIEEERPEVKPDAEQRDTSSSDIVRHPNYQNHSIWLPSGNMNHKENKKNMELPPQFFNGWIPVSGKWAGDVKQQDQDDQKAKQFKWPIIWMPAGCNEIRQEAKELKEMDERPKVSEEAPPSPKIKIIPLSWFENGHNDQEPSVKDESHHNERSTVKKQSSGTEHQDGREMKNIPFMPKKESEEKKPIRENCKTIPVMPRNDNENKPAGGNYRTIPVMPVKDSDDKKPDASVQKDEKKASSTEKEEENGKRSNEASSKAKNSKLPPVCLRVDPLPRKKSGNGSSRSPSPPTRKDADIVKKDVKVTHMQKQDVKLSDPKKERTVSEAKEKAPDEMNKGRAYGSETVQATSVKQMQEEQIPTRLADQKVQATGVNFDAQENVGEKNLQGSDKNTEGEAKLQDEPAKDADTTRINFSELDAAVCIQSAYRGYNVRRWQPLEKLRMIKNVNEQMKELKEQLQGIEASSKQLTVKEQVAINETIMNLLLKLDTIQGLHPSVREARKSVARELISLQEKLDSLCKQSSGEFIHTNGEKEKPEAMENNFQSTAPVSAIEASEKEKAAGVDEEQGMSTIDSKLLMPDAVSSVVSTDTTQGADSIDHVEESNTTNEEAPNGGKVATQCDCQGEPSMDVMGDAALLGHSTEHKEQIEESNAISMDKSCEREKDVPPVGGQEIPSGDHMEPLHDEALSERSNELQQYTTSERSSTVISPAAADNNMITMATTSVESGVSADKVSPVEGQVTEAAVVESLESDHDVAPVEEDQFEEPNATIVDSADSSVSLKNEELQDHDQAPSGSSIMSNSAEQPEEASDVNMQQQVENVDTTQDATEESDATPEIGMVDVTNADAENYVQSPLLQTTSELQSTTEQNVLKEPKAAKQSEVSGEYESVLVGKQNESNLTGDSAKAEEPPLVGLGMEADIHESAPRELKDEPILPETESSELSCEHGDITGHEDSEMYVPPECETCVQKESSCVDRRRADVQVPKEVECDELGDDYPKEDASVQTENMASEEASLASATPDGMEDENKVAEETTSNYVTPTSSKSDNENKLAEENQKLKEMLQNLLASGSDQMGVITELSEKVKTLERKLARKKRPKVRVHRPTRQATTKVH
uniref:BAG domain-containing protein n=1 Tax=Oryza punctata TaxID=4537 RepID=A0A0E0JY53_ORYPU